MFLGLVHLVLLLLQFQEVDQQLTYHLVSTVTGIGVYGITAALSPAISMTITAPAVAGVQGAINETITLAKGLTAQTAIRDDIITKLSALAVFNGLLSAIYTVAS